MFEALSDRLDGIFRSLSGKGKLTEANMKDALQEIRKALLEADVNFQVVKQFIADIQDKALGQEVISSVEPGQFLVKLVHDELIRIMGENNAPLEFAAKGPTVIMMVGLQGQGKTTTSGKIALQLKKKGRTPLLVGADVYRPAAIKQLEVVAEQAGCPFFSLGAQADPVDICVMAMGEAKMKGCDTIILDTAGRLHVDEAMMGEVKRIQTQVKPQEILFVANAMQGQDAVNVVKQFHANLPLTGVVLTQMDGDARGGAALSLIAVTGCPVKFIGTGERLENLESFHPRRLADQVLGMGDIVTLVERAQEVVDQDKAAKFQKKMKKASWDLEDFLEQILQVKKLGSMNDIIKMLPGMSKMLPKDLNIDDSQLKYTEAIIHSMTVKERRNPQILNPSRRKRIATGSGTSLQEVNRLLKEYEKMKKMMKQVLKGGGKFPKGKKGLMGRGMGMPNFPGLR